MTAKKPLRWVAADAQQEMRTVPRMSRDFANVGTCGVPQLAVTCVIIRHIPRVTSINQQITDFQAER
jgi:hypothetical protein